jgi:hypothetical protein
MSSIEQPQEHQVGITNAQEANPDAQISRLMREMNTLFAAKQFTEAARIALSITALSKDELRGTFERHGVNVLQLDHEAFGIYGVIEPSYDLHVDGGTPEVLAAATEFGKRHAQQAVLVARKLREGESEPAGRMGLMITLNAPMTIDAAIPMNTPKTSDDVMREMNDLARKLGRQPKKHAWEIEPQTTSIFDVPMTTEEEARICRLDALISQLERTKTAVVSDEPQDVPSRVQDIGLPS